MEIHGEDFRSLVGVVSDETLTALFKEQQEEANISTECTSESLNKLLRQALPNPVVLLYIMTVTSGEEQR